MTKVIAVLGFNDSQVASVCNKLRELCKIHDELKVENTSDLKYACERLEEHYYRIGGKDMLLIGSAATVISEKAISYATYTDNEGITTWIKQTSMDPTTHQIVIPSDTEFKYLAHEAVLQAVITHVLPNVPTLVLPNKSKEGNWALIVQFLTGIITKA